MAEHAGTAITLQDANSHYLQSARDAKSNGAAIQHFVRWFGATRTLQTLRPADIERYGEETSKSSGEAQRRLEAVRSFLAFARKEGYTDVNLALHLRLRRSGVTDGGGDTLTAERIEVSQEGLAALQSELSEMLSRRPEMAEELRLAMADKDFRENAPLDAAREKQAHMEARIRELESIMKRAVVVDAAGDASGRARMGSKIRLRRLDNDQEIEYTLVGPGEVDARQRRISVQSPVGRAVVNCSAGDEVEVAAPAGMIRFRLEAVES
ncbi:MAG: GreA/GreB family elongation factor [Dehalococcoidia bacterium]